MNCEQCRQEFAAAIEGLSNGDPPDGFAAHLATCPGCRAEFEATRRLVTRLKNHASELRGMSPALSDPVADRIIREQALQLRRIEIMRRRITRLSTAAALLVGLGTLIGLMLSRSAGNAYAEELRTASQAMERIKTATWNMNFYMRFLDKGRRTSKWVRVRDNDQRYFYKAPGLYRRESLDEGGKVIFVAIEDVKNRTSLELNAREKMATLRYLAEPSYSPLGPFATYTETMKSKDLQGLGQKEIGGVLADGYRSKFFVEGANQNWSYELWIDSKTKKLIQGQIPGGDIFSTQDVVSDRTWDPSLQSIEVDGKPYHVSNELGLGNSSHLVSRIVVDKPLDDDLFSLRPPPGYAVTTATVPTVSEKDVVEFLGIMARYFGGTFPDRALEFNHGEEYGRFERVERDVLANKGGTDAEVAMINAMHQWWREGLPGPGPLHMFIQREIEEDSWKYVGDGVKLGDKARIVCWYRPKESKKYHVVHGDLSVTQVDPANLPLPANP